MRWVAVAEAEGQRCRRGRRRAPPRGSGSGRARSARPAGAPRRPRRCGSPAPHAARVRWRQRAPNLGIAPNPSHGSDPVAIGAGTRAVSVGICLLPRFRTVPPRGAGPAIRRRRRPSRSRGSRRPAGSRSVRRARPRARSSAWVPCSATSARRRRTTISRSIQAIMKSQYRDQQSLSCPASRRRACPRSPPPPPKIKHKDLASSRNRISASFRMTRASADLRSRFAPVGLAPRFADIGVVDRLRRPFIFLRAPG